MWHVPGNVPPPPVPRAGKGGAIPAVAPPLWVRLVVRIGVAGIQGRVGRLLVEEIEAAGATLAGGTVRAGTQTGPGLFDEIALLAGQADVIIDFSHPDATDRHAATLAAAKVPWVLGTTGLTPLSEQAVDRAATRIVVIQAANFSPGVTLVTGLARRMAAALPAETYDAEIVEMHHRHKLDAPSGTALALGEAVAAGRGVRLADVRDSGRDGQTGARRTGAIGFAALRGGLIVGEHGLSFTAGSEQISLGHRAFDRRVFATGAVRAALWTAGRAPGRYDMEDVLGLR